MPNQLSVLSKRLTHVVAGAHLHRFRRGSQKHADGTEKETGHAARFSVVQDSNRQSGSSGKELRVDVLAFARRRSFMAGVTTGIVFERRRRTTTLGGLAAPVGFFAFSASLISTPFHEDSLAAFARTDCRPPDRTPSTAASRSPATTLRQSPSRPEPSCMPQSPDSCPLRPAPAGRQSRAWARKNRRSMSWMLTRPNRCEPFTSTTSSCPTRRRSGLARSPSPSAP